MKASTLVKELKKISSPNRRQSNEWFFKTGKGQYGEGDKFIGVRVPDIRQLAKSFLNLDFIEIKKLFESQTHEVRLAGILILVEKNKLAIKSKDNILRKKIVKFYLRNRKRINNWDLVDLSVHYVLGQAILDGLQDKNILYKYAVSKNMWERRMSIIATWIFIREGKLDDCFKLSKILLGDKEDLMHKAVGWMLREAWKKDASTGSAQNRTEKFLKDNYKKLPRTTLRYAIERMEETKRKRYLQGNI